MSTEEGTKNARKARELDEITEDAFLKTVEANDPNFAILVLAIGEWASRPFFKKWTGPEWAFDACRRYFAESINGTRKITSTTKGSPGRSDDGRVLTLVADLLIDPDVRKEFSRSEDETDISENRAIKIAISCVRGVVPNEVEQREINRLAYHWHADRDRRLEAACKRRGLRLMAKNPLRSE